LIAGPSGRIHEIDSGEGYGLNDGPSVFFGSIWEDFFGHDLEINEVD